MHSRGPGSSEVDQVSYLRYLRQRAVALVGWVLGPTPLRPKRSTASGGQPSRRITRHTHPHQRRGRPLCWSDGSRREVALLLAGHVVCSPRDPLLFLLLLVLRTTIKVSLKLTAAARVRLRWQYYLRDRTRRKRRMAQPHSRSVKTPFKLHATAYNDNNVITNKHSPCMISTTVSASVFVGTGGVAVGPGVSCEQFAARRRHYERPACCAAVQSSIAGGATIASDRVSQMYGLRRLTHKRSASLFILLCCWVGRSYHILVAPPFAYTCTVETFRQRQTCRAALRHNLPVVFECGHGTGM